MWASSSLGYQDIRTLVHVVINKSEKRNRVYVSLSLCRLSLRKSFESNIFLHSRYSNAYNLNLSYLQIFPKRESSYIMMSEKFLVVYCAFILDLLWPASSIHDYRLRLRRNSLQMDSTPPTTPIFSIWIRDYTVPRSIEGCTKVERFDIKLHHCI